MSYSRQLAPHRPQRAYTMGYLLVCPL
uniref:Uncharacterized protein n=1 Tax=Arundo donax TaxID=35708 RepID=A0A0A9B4L2_ARUDO